jgi:hypothetical protein
MMLVAVCGAVLASSLVVPIAGDPDCDTQVSAGVASVRPSLAPALRAPARTGALRIVAALPAVPPPLVATARRLERSPDGVAVLALSSPLRTSRGPPASISDR